MPGRRSWRSVARNKGLDFRSAVNRDVERSFCKRASACLEVQERETDGPWITTRVKKGSFFLTSAGSPYDCRWRTLTSEPFEYMMVLLGLPLLERALEEVFGADAIHAQLRDVSGFTDATLDSWVEQLHGELMRRKASPFSCKASARQSPSILRETTPYGQRVAWRESVTSGL